MDFPVVMGIHFYRLRRRNDMYWYFMIDVDKTTHSFSVFIANFVTNFPFFLVCC